MRRYAARRDANEGEIVRALEKVGASVLRLHDIDLLVGFRGRNYLLEVKDGRKSPSNRPLTPQQVEQMTALVRESIGFSKDRGDSVNVVNAVFNVTKAPETETAAWWMQSDNQELADAPASAHVKRTAQESFEPPAFTLRRSMPWVQGESGGLLFVSFGHSFDAFEAQLRRMIGMDDGLRDAVFGMSQPVSGAYFWCPPVTGQGLDLRLLRL